MTALPLDQIAEGLTALHRFVQDHPAACDVTDEHGANRTEFEKLRWLAESLENYLRRAGNLFFVGFLGHYSSGKSSTINSLAGHELQATDQLPTDTGVTLLTHPANESILAPLAQGGLKAGALGIAIYPKLHPAELFRSIVLMDTPGSGDVPGIVDANLLDEVVREFLPLCDLLVYCFNAAVPLDKADMPLLEKKQRQLPGIPTLFVVTRADEFRKDHDRPLDKDNFDGERAAHVQRGLLARIEEALARALGDGPAVHRFLNECPVLMVNNRGGQFNIDRLANHLRQQAEAHIQGGSNRLHEHKVAYFQARSQEKWQTFLYWIQERAGAARKLRETVASNFDRFRLNLRHVVERLEKEWEGYHRKLDDTRKLLLDRAPRALYEQPPDDGVLAGDRLDAWFGGARKKSQQAAVRLAAEATRALAGPFQALVRERLRFTLQQMPAEDPTRVALPPLGPDDLLPLLSSGSLVPVHLWTDEDLAVALDELRDEMNRVLDSLSALLVRRYEGLERVLRDDTVQRFESVLQAARVCLREQILKDHYFSLIESYQAGVTTAHAYTVFATIPEIAARLQQAHRRMNDEERQAHVESVTQQFFPAEEAEVTEEFRRRLLEFRQQAEEARSRVPPNLTEPIRPLATSLRDTLEQEAREHPESVRQGIADQLAVRHAATVETLLAEARVQIQAHLQRVDLQAGQARERAQESARKAEDASRQATEARAAVESAQIKADLSRTAAKLARERATLARRQSDRTRGKRSFARRSLTILGIILAVLSPLAMVWWLANLRKTSWGGPIWAWMSNGGTMLIMLAVAAFVGDRLYRKRLHEAEGIADDATTAANKAQAEADSAGEAVLQAERRAAEAERHADAMRREAARELERYHQLVRPGDQEQPNRYAPAVLEQCGGIVEGVFADYLHRDEAIETVLRERYTGELQRQLDLLAGSELLSRCRQAHELVSGGLGQAARLRKETMEAIRELTQRCSRVFAQEGARSPQAIFEAVQKQAIQPSLDMVEEHCGYWDRLETELGELARKHDASVVPC
jgi:predicted GTPase